MISVDMKSHKDEFESELKEKINLVLDAMGGAGEGYAVQTVAVDTGRLRSSITHAIVEEENAVYIGTNVEYGKYVELGTVKMGARPFLKPAATEHTEEYKELAEKIFKQ